MFSCSRQTIKSSSTVQRSLYSTRTATNPNSIPRRPTKKIQIGKARPAVYHKFTSYVELSDGSVIERKTQYPKTELRMIHDQRNNPLWNESRTDIHIAEDVKGKLFTFRQKYSDFDTKKKTEETTTVEENTAEGGEEEETDDLLELLGSTHVEKKLGGRLYEKKNERK